ncbi:hypothetical protein Ancab_018007 [Ancistrocladus abbreviatus]
MDGSGIKLAGELGRPLKEEVAYLYGVRDKVEELQSELEWMQCFLLDADAKQHKNAVIRKWVPQMKDLAYEAEDTIEKFIIKVSYQDRHDSFWSKVKWFLCCLRDAMMLHEVDSDIDVLVLKISKLTTRLQTYGIKTTYEGTSSSTAMRSELRQTYSHLAEDVVVGIDDDINKLATELVNDQHHKVIAVDGMGGQGKTTLARKVYHHHSVREHFSGGLAWAYVSQQFQTRNVLLGILLQLVSAEDENRRKKIQELQDGQLPGELYQMLKENNYLVVFDDVWNTEDWNRLQPAFPVTDHDSFGSKILVTTRNSEILSGLGPLVLYHEPKLLEDPKDWELLQKKAFLNTDEEIDSGMIEFGKEMLKHCKGLPLAIVVLGGVLATKKTLEDWQNVQDNIIQYFGRSMASRQSFSGVFDVFAMSYYDLDYHLKRCFLYLAFFPEDFEIPAKKLYCLWIAEGMVASSDGEIGVNLEDAECYLRMSRIARFGHSLYIFKVCRTLRCTVRARIRMYASDVKCACLGGLSLAGLW